MLLLYKSKCVILLQNLLPFLQYINLTHTLFQTHVLIIRFGLLDLENGLIAI
jgi:hypothetical protein